MAIPSGEGRSKAARISEWLQGEGETLVKVKAFGEAPSQGRPVGYCTKYKFIVGRTPAEMERILGFKSDTRLAQGAEVYLVRPLPKAGDFEFRGYSNTPEGISTSEQPAHDLFPPGSGCAQWEVTGCMQHDHLVHLATVRPGSKLGIFFRDLPKPI